jgi:hypothetical protein
MYLRKIASGARAIEWTIRGQVNKSASVHIQVWSYGRPEVVISEAPVPRPLGEVEDRCEMA